MREHRKLLVAGVAVVVGYLAGVGLRELRAPTHAGASALAAAPQPGAAAVQVMERQAIERQPVDREPQRRAPEAAAPAAGELPAILPLPDVAPGAPPIRPGLGSLVTGRPVEPGERLPPSPFAAWTRQAAAVPTSAGVDVVLWTAGSQEPPAAEKGGTPIYRIPSAKIPNETRSWFLTAASPQGTSVLSLYESSPFFARADLDCTDSSPAPSVREVRAQPATLWVELDEIWTCEPIRRPGVRPVDPPLHVNGPFGLDRRVGLVVVVEPDGTLRRLAAGIPLLERRSDGATGVLEGSVAENGVLTLAAGTTAPSENQEEWIGAWELDPLLRQAVAAPTWIDEALPGGPVPADCAPRRSGTRLAIEADPPVEMRTWAANPAVTVLGVPAGSTRVRLRAVAIDAGGARIDVTDDRCLRLQLAGAGLRPMPTRSLFEVTGGAERLEWASVVALYRGQRVVVRFEETRPLAPAIPPAAAAVLAGALPGLHLPDADLAAGWDLASTGPGLVVGDLDWDGREDVAALLLDRERWEVAVLTRTRRGEYQLAFHTGAPRAPSTPGQPVEQLALRRTPAGDLSLRRTRGPGGEEWIVHHRGTGFTRTVLPLVRADLGLSADQLGIAPHGAHLDLRTAGRDELIASLVAGDAETFAALPALAPAQKAAAAAAIADALRDARDDRSRLLWGLGLLGRPAAEAAAAAVGVLLDGRGAAWRSEVEPRAAEVALSQMGELGLQLLAAHPDAEIGARAAAEIVRGEPELRALAESALRRHPERLAAALVEAPITSPDDLASALRMMAYARRPVVQRLRALARAPRTPETTALLTAALPFLVEELSTESDAAGAADVAALVGELGPIAAPALPALQGARWSHDCRVRVAARRALSALRGEAKGLDAGDRELAVECPRAVPPRTTATKIQPLGPAPLPGDALVVRLMDRIDERGYGFVAPIDLDWRRLAQTSLPGLEDESGARLAPEPRKAGEGESADRCVPFQAPLPQPLRSAHYYGVTAAGVLPLEPRKVLGDVCVGPFGAASYRGRVEAGVVGDGFVIVSGKALTVSQVSRDALAPLWPKVAAACAIDPSSRPKGIAFKLGPEGKSAQYAYAILPAGDLCSDRRRLLRIDGETAEVVEATDSGCAL